MGFLGTNDYNNPSDVGEYRFPVERVKLMVNNLLSGKIQASEIKYNIGALNTHGVPLYMIYLIILSNFGLLPQAITPLINSLLPSIVFLTASLFLPLFIALVFGIITVIYTPTFSFIFSYMPEGFTAVVIPLLIIVASLIVNRGTKPIIFVFVGVCLALIGFSRHVFTYYGFLFILAWYFLAAKRIRKKQVLFIFLGYIPLIFVWFIIVKWSGTSPYPQSTVLSQIYHSFNLETQGWAMGYGVSGVSWSKIISLILHQNLLDQVMLRIERITLFLEHPAIAYTTSFPLSVGSLKVLHELILAFALLGIRGAFKNKILFLLFMAILWNTVFASVYVIEELRLQLPVTGLIIIFAGIGFREFLELFENKQTRKSIIYLIFLALAYWGLGEYIIGLEIWFFPFITDANIWVIINSLFSIISLLFACRKLWDYDRRTTLSIKFKWLRRFPSLVPLAIFILFLVPYIRNPEWHSWHTPLVGGWRIEQTITLRPDVLNQLKNRQGYLLVDMQDPNAARYMTFTLNGNTLTQRLSMKSFYDPVSLNALRQWQQNWPRLGYGHTEKEMASASAWPDMRQWLVLPIPGSLLKRINEITLKNDNYFTSQYPLIFGDFAPYGSEDYYEGPAARIFQGKHAYNKYQVDGDFRLYAKQKLLSVSNSSKFFISGDSESKGDLSSLVGRQNGRYRIFFLFPHSVYP